MTTTIPTTDETARKTPGSAPRMIILGLLPVDGDIAGLVEAVNAAQGSGAVSGAEALPFEVRNSLLGSLGIAPEGNRPGAASRAVRLTQRERQVYERIAEGLSNKQIASRLGIAIHTVKCHVHSILEKLGLESRLQVAVFGRGSFLNA